MHCFYHSDVDAVGLCKACGKGLCRPCAVDLGEGLACQNSCELLVRDQITTRHANNEALLLRPGRHKTNATIGMVTALSAFGLAIASAAVGIFVTAPMMLGIGAGMLYFSARERSTYKQLLHITRQLPPSSR